MKITHNPQPIFHNPMNNTLKTAAPVLLAGLGTILSSCAEKTPERPNVVFVLIDEWRAQDLGYTGNTDVITPNIDRLASESVNLYNTISGCPVCSPYRGSWLTGQYPLTNGVFMNDVLLYPEAETFPKVFNAAGYETAYIGKWHLDGHG
jgi:arylsulfatase A-like enzyme